MHLIFKTGLTAAKKNIAPGLLLQGFALTIVLLYYFHEPTQLALLKIPEIQQQMGVWFPLLATAFFGGVIPHLFLLFRKKIAPGRRASTLLFLIGFWAFLGLSVDLFYKSLSLLFGNQPNVATIIKKVLVDQLVFSVFWAAPLTTLAMFWKDHGFSLMATRKDLSRKFITMDIPVVLIALWGVWAPTMAIVYSLPLALQFPLFNIVLCFWSLLLTTLKPAETQAE